MAKEISLLKAAEKTELTCYTPPIKTNKQTNKAIKDLPLLRLFRLFKYSQ